MKKQRSLLLAALLATVLSVFSGCLIQPDPTLDPLAIDSGDEGAVAPFSTAAPLPSGAPTPVPATPTPGTDNWTANDSSQWEDWSAGDVVALPTPSPAANGTPTPAPTSWITSTEDYNTGYPVLRVGSSGSVVSDLQTRLRELGYYTSTIDGLFSTGTQSAVEAFQAANGLSADGIAGRETQDKLYSTSAVAKTVSAQSNQDGYSLLQNGSYGTSVRKLQVRLSELGYYSGGADGVYGTATETAVKSFQRNNGLSGDGQAGEATQTKLFSSTAKSASKPVTTPNPNQTRTLTIGMEGNDVFSAQERLIALGYLNGVADGMFGTETQAAVNAFQTRNGLTVDGQVGATTLKKLQSNGAKTATGASATPEPASPNALALTIGASGEYVYNLQARLFELGYYTGRIDGRFYDSTAAAVKAFQAVNGLTADGIAGGATLNKLDSANAIALNGSVPGGVSNVTITTAVPSVTQTPNTGNASALTTTLSQGASGTLVQLLQQNLARLGYYTGVVDGDYGTSTAAAVMLFQQKNSLGADGVAGPGTLSVLYSGLAVPYEQPAPVVTAPPATTPPDTTTTLYEGLGGEPIRTLQNRLAALGFLTQAQVDGHYGKTTTTAVKAFQRRNNLSADGVAGPGTLAALYSDSAISAEGSAGGGGITTAPPDITSTLQSGSSGDLVVALQNRLKELGYLSGSVDGYFGPGTVSALKAFQARNGLTSDGVAGPGTQTVLYSSVAIGYANEEVGEVPTISVSNTERQKSERHLNGALQISIAGGGIVTNDKSHLYFADANNGGALSRRLLGGGLAEKLSSDVPRFLHATNGRLYYVATRGGKDCVIRFNLSDGDERTALSVGTIRKFALHDGNFYYMDQSGTVYRYLMEGGSNHLYNSANDFVIDASNDRIYLATDGGVVRMRLSDGDALTLSSHGADKITLCGSACYFLSSGGMYRIYNDTTQLVRTGAITWIGAYASHVYYLENGMIYRCDANGKNSKLMDGGSGYTQLSIAEGILYAGTAKGFTTMISL